MVRFLNRLFFSVLSFVLWHGSSSESLAQPRPPDSYEIWVTNQTEDNIQIFHSGTLKPIAKIPVDQDKIPQTSKPHTIQFSPDRKFAYVANVGSKANTNNILVIRAKDRKIIATIPTGPGAHMVLPSPDGRRAFAAIFGDDSVVEILTDTRKNRFTKGRTFPIQSRSSGRSRPTCLAFSADGKKLYVTNAGDPLTDPRTAGFLVVLDVNTGQELSRISDISSESCGLERTQDGTKIFFTMGGTEGKFATLDTKTDRMIKMVPIGRDDPHGLALMPGGRQIWITSRLSNSIAILNPTLGRHLLTHFNIGERPDLLDFSPNGSEVVVSLRGLPVTRIPGGSGGSLPGFLILNAMNGKVLSKVPMEGDPHGIATRPR